MSIETPKPNRTTVKSRLKGLSKSNFVFERFSAQMQSTPESIPEESILLRIFVQCLVSIGIIATDISAGNVTAVGLTSLWAVPVSAVGATWSWYRRRSRNIPTKFCIAIAMLLALVVFFDQLLRQQQDTRLALAYLLIQLQVFHSFDLPRRKDLGYSMLIGLILVGVAATLSQTLLFAPFLIAFLVCALPTLILDYRSKLGLSSQPLKHSLTALPLWRLVAIFGVTIALGLLIFAFFPRFQGYQIQTFPVSAPIEFQGEFNTSIINNPGYGNEINPQESGFGTNSEGDETFDGAPGEIDTNSYYGFSTRMNLNLRGELTPKVVMRVRSQSEGFWRVLAFDRYVRQGWEISRNDEEDIQIIERPRWTFLFNLPWSINQGRNREVIQTFNITAEMPNLIPSLYEPKKLYFPTEQIAIDPEGGLRSPINLVDGITYSVVSDVPYRDRTRLREASTIYSDAIREHYLQIPSGLTVSLRETVEEILAKADPIPSDPYEISLYLAQYLKQNYTLQPELPFLEPGEDVVESFLFRYEGGYPDHFSTVLTLMLRSIGIPARLVAGFAPGEFNPFTGFYVVKNVDAYAMAEVYFPSYGWFPFDPIPGHELIPPTVEDYETFGVLKQFWNWVAGWLPSPIRGILAELIDVMLGGLTTAITFVVSLLSQGWFGILLGLVLLTALAFIGWIVFIGLKTLKRQLRLRTMPPMEALYEQMLAYQASQGLQKSSAQTPLEYARSLKNYQSTEQVAVIEDISVAYVQWRYGKKEPEIAKLSQQWRSLFAKTPKLKKSFRSM